MKRPSTKTLAVTMFTAAVLLAATSLLSAGHSVTANRPPAEWTLAEAQSRARTGAVTGLVSKMEGTARPTTTAVAAKMERQPSPPPVPARADEPALSEQPASRSMPAVPTDAAADVRPPVDTSPTVVAKAEPITPPAVAPEPPKPTPSTEERAVVPPTPSVDNPTPSPTDATPPKTAAGRGGRQRGNPDVVIVRPSREQAAEMRRAMAKNPKLLAMMRRYGL